MKNIAITMSLGLLAGSCLSSLAQAACTNKPDCATLGYNKTSCTANEEALKCPFDASKLMCVPKSCEAIGKKTCGDWCITSEGCCSNSDCNTGQTCDNHVCKDVICAVGDIYYSDKTCSSDLISDKTPIGVVGHITNSGKNGVVVALDTAYDNKTNTGIQWGCHGTDLSLTNYQDQTSAKTDFSGSANTNVIVSQCGSGTAAYYCKNTYSKGGVSGWYLPAYGELYAILYTNFSTVNNGLGKIASNNQITYGYWYWSSSEISSGSAFEHGSGTTTNYAYYKGSTGYVRCVLAF